MEWTREGNRCVLALVGMGTAVGCTGLWAVARVRSPRPTILVAGMKDLVGMSQQMDVGFPLLPSSGEVPFVVNDEPGFLEER